jgi:uncharacterized protein (TIGR02118 family)
MTVKLIVTYTKPDDPAEFDRHYREVHTPIVQRWPGLEQIELLRVTGAPGGGDSPYHLIAELSFADTEALNGALGSEAGMEAYRDFRGIAPEGSFMTVVEVTE